MCKPLFRPTPSAFSIGICHLITESDRKKGRNVAEARAAAVIGARQTISDNQAEPEFQETHRRLKAERLAREAAEKAKK